MSVVERFLRYIRFDTQSSETSGTTPSTPGQRVFAEALVKELQELGLEEIVFDGDIAGEYGKEYTGNRVYRPLGYQSRYVG